MTSQSIQPIIQGLFDPATWTVTYIVHHGAGTACAIIDSVLDYDPKSGTTSTASADKVADYVKANRLGVEWILEAHAHADHLSAAQYLKKQLGGKLRLEIASHRCKRCSVVFSICQHANQTRCQP